MFTTIKPKKMMYPLIGTLFVIFSFSTVGCGGKLSDRDKEELASQPHREIKSTKPLKPDKILRVGDKLPPFTSNDVVSRVYTLWSGKLITGFQKNGWIELKNGTRYVCVSPEGCGVANFTIIEGTIAVYYKKER